MSGTVQASDGTALPIDSLAVALVSSGGFTTSLTVQYASQSRSGTLSYFTETFTNDGTYYTGWSGWILGDPV